MVPAGGFTKPIVVSKVALVLKFDIENPLAFWLDKFWEKLVDDGALMFWEKTNIGNKNNTYKNPKNLIN